MKLIYSLLFTLFQISNGLKIDSIGRKFRRSVSDAIQLSANHLASASRQFISVAVLGSLISISPATHFMPANAISNGASQLFSEAETAIEANQKDFKLLDQEWNIAKKIIGDNANLLSKATASLTGVTTKMAEYDTSITKMVDEDVLATASIQTEIENLRESAGVKYAAAEASAAIPAKPSVTAQLFLKAQNEVSTLAQDEKILKDFAGVVAIDSSLKKRADDVLAGLTATVGKAAEIQTIQAAGLADMNAGLDTNFKACKDSFNECAETGEAGLLQFRSGVKTVDEAEEKFSKLKDDVVAYLRSVKTIEADLLKSTTKMSEMLVETSTWEEATKLKLKNGKSSVKSVNQKYEKTLKETASMIEKLTGTNDLLTNKNSNNRKEVSDTLRINSAQLEVADKSSKLAEKLMKQAKAQGDKEAAKYLKFIPAPLAATAPTTTPEAVKK